MPRQLHTQPLRALEPSTGCSAANLSLQASTHTAPSGKASSKTGRNKPPPRHAESCLPCHLQRATIKPTTDCQPAKQTVATNVGCAPQRQCWHWYWYCGVLCFIGCRMGNNRHRPCTVSPQPLQVCSIRNHQTSTHSLRWACCQKPRLSSSQLSFLRPFFTGHKHSLGSK